MSKEEALSTVALVVGVFLPALVTVFFNAIPGAIGGSNLPRWGVRLPILLTCAAHIWFTLVSRAVPEPYLDEIFHIPQAQRYCRGKFFEWDDKITTPPGLYLFSVLVQRAASTLGASQLSICDEFSLRAINFAGVLGVSYLALWCRRAIEARQHEASSTGSPARVRAFSQYAVHTAINIGLFPPLFFLAGLYYTDVLSTAVVLAAFLNHLARVGCRRSSLVSDLATMLLGISALFMRQTNVFWVVVFMGGLEAVHAVKTLRPKKVVVQPATRTLWAHTKYFAARCSVGDIHDLPIHLAYPDDMIFTALSIGIAAICNPIVVIRQVWPYLAVLLSFAGFVQWNGGVVLGDKSNHVATIHLPQMLYIWPFFAFFSLPLLLPSILSFLDMLATTFSEATNTSAPAEPKKAETHSHPPSSLLGATVAIFHSKILWPIYLAATGVLSLIIVEFNTIVHPFTLADNRHYMFYVFRYTIRRGRWIRLALVLPYTLCRWMVWDALGGHNSWSGVKQPTAHVNHPFQELSSYNFTRQSKSQPQSQSQSPPETTTSSASPLSYRKTHEAALKAELEADSLFLSTKSVPTSTSLVLFVATSLSLITAPLVEPRYYIVPWVMWRLMVPAWRLRDHLSGGFAAGRPMVHAVAEWSAGYDVRLFLESAWHLAINLVAGYIFLCKPYVWKAEDGTVLEEGRLQRFMW